jgi:hypothetical protein
MGVSVQPHSIRPYADGVADYALAGWPCILPVPSAAKSPPPVGYTGADGLDTDPQTLVTWAASHAESSIALRLPEGVIGIDVDHYAKVSTLPDGTTRTVDKRGGDWLAEYETRWGLLPATWRSSARDLPSGIRFYRVPAGRYATKLGEAIEIIQRHHRYAVVAPSPHHAAGAPYRWYDPSGALSDSVPKPIELPELPEAWVARLREGASEAGPAAAEVGRGQALLSAIMVDRREACAEVADAHRRALTELAAVESGSRHDTAIARVHHLVMLGAAGHPGAAEALLTVRSTWEALTAGEGRLDEFDRMLLTSARKAVSVVGSLPVDRDPCFSGPGLVQMAAPGPVDNRAGEAPPDGPDLEPIEPPRFLHPFEVIGAHEFNPRGHLDQTLADAVLERTQPALRYAHDARVWLLRGPDVWEARGDLAGWAVALLADRMPQGDPDGEKGSDARDQADRRKRFMTTSTARGIAAKMRDRVAGGIHPCSLSSATSTVSRGSCGPAGTRGTCAAAESSLCPPGWTRPPRTCTAPRRRPRCGLRRSGTPSWPPSGRIPNCGRGRCASSRSPSPGTATRSCRSWWGRRTAARHRWSPCSCRCWAPTPTPLTPGCSAVRTRHTPRSFSRSWGGGCRSSTRAPGTAGWARNASSSSPAGASSPATP